MSHLKKYNQAMDNKQTAKTPPLVIRNLTFDNCITLTGKKNWQELLCDYGHAQVQNEMIQSCMLYKKIKCDPSLCEISSELRTDIYISNLLLDYYNS